MAIQKIEVIDNNKVGDCDLLAVHNPLVYTIKMSLDDSGDAYDDVIEVDVNISGNETEFIGTFNCPFLEQLNTNERLYIFNADEILRSGLNTIEDFEQDFNDKTSETDLVADSYLTKGFYLTFRADPDGTPIEVVETLSAVHASRDFEDENGASMTEICDNESKMYIGGEGLEEYVYDYLGNEVNTWGVLLTNMMVDGAKLSGAFMKEDGNFGYGVSYMYRGFSDIVDNPKYGIVSYIPTMKLNPIDPNEVQIGANESETIDNLISYFKGFDIAGNITTVTWSGNDHIVFNDISKWARPDGISFILTDTDLFTLPSHDGNTFGFAYTDIDSVVHEVLLIARVTPTQPNEFQINSSKPIVYQNIIDVLKSYYPYFEDFDCATGNQTGTIVRLTIQEPQIDTSIPGTFAEAVSTATIYIYNRSQWIWSPESLTPTFLRKKILVDQSEPFEVTMTNVNHVVYPKPFCEGSIYMKYVDRNGQYRFMIGESRYSKKVNPSQIGSINRIVTSLKDDLGDEINVGFRNSNSITVKLAELRSDLKFKKADGNWVYLDEIELLKDFYNSPDTQVFLNNKWITVIVKGENIIKLKKGASASPIITLTLPKSYNITQL